MKLVMKIKKETGKSLKEAMHAAKKVYKKGTSSKKTKKTKKTKRRRTRKARKGKSKRRRR